MRDFFVIKDLSVTAHGIFLKRKINKLKAVERKRSTEESSYRDSVINKNEVSGFHREIDAGIFLVVLVKERRRAVRVGEVLERYVLHLDRSSVSQIECNKLGSIFRIAISRAHVSPAEDAIGNLKI